MFIEALPARKTIYDVALHCIPPKECELGVDAAAINMAPLPGSCCSLECAVLFRNALFFCMCGSFISDRGPSPLSKLAPVKRSSFCIQLLELAAPKN